MRACAESYFRQSPAWQVSANASPSFHSSRRFHILDTTLSPLGCAAPAARGAVFMTTGRFNNIPEEQLMATPVLHDDDRICRHGIFLTGSRPARQISGFVAAHQMPSPALIVRPPQLPGRHEKRSGSPAARAYCRASPPVLLDHISGSFARGTVSAPAGGGPAARRGLAREHMK